MACLPSGAVLKSNIGFKTYSANNFTADSGAGGTAGLRRRKLKMVTIGMTPDSPCCQSILEVARNGLSTGVVVACDVTHAPVASFIAHQVSRKMTKRSLVII